MIRGKRGIESKEFLIDVALVVLLMAIIFAIYGIIRGKGTVGIERILNLFRFGGG